MGEEVTQRILKATKSGPLPCAIQLILNSPYSDGWMLMASLDRESRRPRLRFRHRLDLDQDIGKIDVDIRTSGLGIRPKVSLEFGLSISSLAVIINHLLGNLWHLEAQYLRQTSWLTLQIAKKPRRQSSRFRDGI